MRLSMDSRGPSHEAVRGLSGDSHTNLIPSVAHIRSDEVDDDKELFVDF